VTEAAAVIFAIAVAGIVAFQVGLGLGAPWGAYAMGGRYPGRFPPPMRIAAVVQAVVLIVLALLVLSVAGLVLPSIGRALPWVAWIAVAFSAVSLVLNLVTPSAVERRLWAPVGAVLLVTSLAVALTAG
jgi:hypothetical protein